MPDHSSLNPADTETLRAAFVQAQAQIMNNGEYTPVVVIDKTLALSLLDEIDQLRAVGERLYVASHAGFSDRLHDAKLAWRELRR